MTLQVSAGQTLTDVLLSQILPQSVIKQADQSIASQTTPQNDTELALPVAANAQYFFALFVDYEGNTTGSGDLKIGLTLPAGATIRYVSNYRTTGGVAVTWQEATNGTNGAVILTNGTGNRLALSAIGSVVVGATAGNLQFQWAQQTSNATATVVHAGSAMLLVRVS